MKIEGYHRVDLLGPNRAMINCKFQIVRVRTLSGGERVITSEGASQELVVCAPARVRKNMQQDCFVFLAYVLDTWVKGMEMMSEVPIFWDFPNIFPEDFLGVTPKR